MSGASALSRRGFFARFMGRGEDAEAPAHPSPRASYDLREARPAPHPAFVAEAARSLEGAARAGKARIDASRCLPFCNACQERCPKSGAIVFDHRVGGLRVVASRCDGCGACVSACAAPRRPVRLHALD